MAFHLENAGEQREIITYLKHQANSSVSSEDIVLACTVVCLDLILKTKGEIMRKFLTVFCIAWRLSAQSNPAPVSGGLGSFQPRTLCVFRRRLPAMSRRRSCSR